MSELPAVTASVTPTGRGQGTGRHGFPADANDGEKLAWSVSHAFAAVDQGQVGLLNVGNAAGTMSH